MPTLADIGNAVSEAIADMGSTTAIAADRANSVSRQAQSAQAAFNTEAMNTANSIGDNRLASQYGFNSAMMSAANNYNTQAWNNAASWNEAMWERQAAFNSEEAEKQRKWQEKMASTQYQRAVQDMSAAGLNPILAVTGGGVGTSVPGGATASVGGTSMSSAQSNMASGGLINPESTSINNYTGQMETLAGILGLMTAMAGSLNSAQNAAQTLADTAGEAVETVIPEKDAKEFIEDTKDLANGGLLDWLEYTFKNRPGSTIMNFLEGSSNEQKKKGQISTRQDEAQYLRYNAWNKSTYKYTKPKG